MEMALAYDSSMAGTVPCAVEAVREQALTVDAPASALTGLLHGQLIVGFAPAR